MITSTSNPQIKQIEKLHKSARERRITGCYLVEGLRMFSEVPQDKLEKAYVTEAFLREHESMFSGKTYELVSENVFQAMSDTTTPQGVLCIVKQQIWTLETLLDTACPLIIALENLQDPGNLGTIIRTAEGAGVTGVVMSRDTVDIYNSKVVRATMGSVFRVPFVYTEDIIKTACQMKDKGIRTYGGDLQGTDVYEGDYRDATAFFIGNEGQGLTKALRASLMYNIRIPMKGHVESLNAATAATVLMYETMRQRR